MEPSPNGVRPRQGDSTSNFVEQDAFAAILEAMRGSRLPRLLDPTNRQVAKRKIPYNVRGSQGRESLSAILKVARRGGSFDFLGFEQFRGDRAGGEGFEEDGP
jgi:hypothetical protein